MNLLFQLIIIFFLGTYNNFNPSNLPTGSLSIKNKSVNIGSIVEGKTISINFEIKNISNKSVNIFSVSTTCGCTIVKYPKKVDAKKHIFINATFNSKGFIGPVKKELVLITDDSLKYYKMEIIGRVIKYN